jgi:hypothetical protein
MGIEDEYRKSTRGLALLFAAALAILFLAVLCGPAGGIEPTGNDGPVASTAGR